MSDADRALGRLRRRAPAPPPIELEDEVTPPPQEPPRPDSLDGYDTMAPPLRAQLDNLHLGQAQLVEAVGKVWELRDGTRFERLEANLVAIAQATTRHQSMLDDLLVPQLDRWRATTDGLAQQLPKLIGMIEGLTLHVRAIDDRLRHLELDVRALGERNAGHAEDIAAREAGEKSLAKRISTLEQVERDRDVTAKALSKSERRKSGLAGGGVGAVVAAIVAAVIEALK